MTLRFSVLLLPWLLNMTSFAWGQGSAEFQKTLDRLQVVGSVLYVAAHPDDENTAALTAFAKGRHLRTAYLSLTRGGGGQDLIGPELDDSLAAIRTQELLAARGIDGAEQFFTRAVDFGYSKSPEESLAIWGHEEVLGDVVRVIRTFRPDVIITRFYPTKTGTHGHHTASAQLALEAFKAAADPARFPEQQKTLKPWQASRIFVNGFRPKTEWEAMAPGSFLTLDVGQYDPLLGKSYLEVAAESRSMHRSQGFGAVPSRGSRLDYFEFLEGSKAAHDLFEGLDLGWTRIPGGAAVGEALQEARQSFRPERPSSALPGLLKAHAALVALPKDPWIAQKQNELGEAIRVSAGIWVEADAERSTVVPGESLSISASILARGDVPVRLLRAVMEGAEGSVDRMEQLRANQPLTTAFKITLPAKAAISQPHWLLGSRTGGLHAAPSPETSIQPRNAPALRVAFSVEVAGSALVLTVPVHFRFRDPVLGERIQPLVVVPPVMVNLAERVHVFGKTTPRRVEFTTVAGGDRQSGRLFLKIPKGWKCEPAEWPFTLAKAGDELKVSTLLTPPEGAGAGLLQVGVEQGGHREMASQRVRIDHPHIPLITLLPPSEAKLVRVDMKQNGQRIGYVMGAGDELPQTLRPLGFQVDLLSDEALETQDLSRYDAIVLGIRAFNTRPRLAKARARLLEYVAKGGTQIVQYNVNGAFPGTNAGLTTESLGPYAFHIGRDRVTDERAPVAFLAPESPVVNFPNRLGPADFEGWVQERGLYFADSWEAPFQPILGMGDPGEKVLQGGLIVAPHGKGHFVYTGLAFFRQLPEGVPGAYRLFANLLALGGHQ